MTGGPSFAARHGVVRADGTVGERRVADLDVSVVVPLYNEAENLPILVEQVREVLGDSTQWELLLVDDGSTDDSPEVGRRLQHADRRVRLVRLARNFGQTAAMQAGFDLARGRVVVSMDGDLQNDPLDIPRLLEQVAAGYDLVVGYRANRQDRAFTRRFPSWVANRIIGRLTGISIKDSGCSLKAYRLELLDRMHLYSDMHRFIPVMAAATFGARITEIPVNHRARRFGQSKYGLSRIIMVLLDLLTICMIRSFRERPLLLFAFLAAAAASLGMAFLVPLAVYDLFFAPADAVGPGQFIPFVASGLLWLGAALHLLLLGLTSEAFIRRTGDSRSLIRRNIVEIAPTRG